MHVRIWAVVVIGAGSCAILFAQLVEAAIVPPGFTAIAIFACPVVALFCGFVGLGTGAYIAGGLTAVAAIATPVLDITVRSLQAGNFDDATLIGLWSGVVLTGVGIIALAVGLRRRPERFASRPKRGVPAL